MNKHNIKELLEIGHKALDEIEGIISRVKCRRKIREKEERNTGCSLYKSTVADNAD